MTQPHYSDASYPAKRQNDRDEAEDGAGLDAIRDEIKKLWAENALLRDDVKTLRAFVHVTQTAVAAVAMMIFVSMIAGGSFADVVRVGGGPPPTGGGMKRAPSAELRLMQTFGLKNKNAPRRYDVSTNIRGRVAGRTVDTDTDATVRSDDGIGTLRANPPAPTDGSSKSSRVLQAGSLELDINEAMLAAAATDTSMPERSALVEFYFSAKGREWTVSTGWLDPSVDHCDWYGVECNDASGGKIVKLELPSNGLSGTLTPRIADLRHLEVLDVTDNDVKGSIPTEIALLSNLTRLKLSYNAFVGDGAYFGGLSRLRLIYLHGNRLSGSIPPMDFKSSSSSSYIADCGNPSDFKSSLLCEECTMCCNNDGYCYPKEETLVQQAGFTNYRQFTGVFIGLVLFAGFAVYLLSFVYNRYRTRLLGLSSDRRTARERDHKYALETLGNESTNTFFLGKSWLGWVFGLKQIINQFWIFLVFVDSSEYNLSDSNVAVQYTWKCTLDNDDCFNTSDLTWQGWLAFGLLMGCHLSKDVINGLKMIILSAKKRHSHRTRMRLFIAGMILVSITLFALYTSIIYNKATANGNSEIIVNSVVILFVLELDENCYCTLRSFLPYKVKSWAWVNKGEYDDSLENCSKGCSPPFGVNAELEGEVATLRKEVEALRDNINLLLDDPESKENLLAHRSDHAD